MRQPTVFKGSPSKYLSRPQLFVFAAQSRWTWATKFSAKTNPSGSFRSDATGRKDHSELPNWGVVLSPLLLGLPPDVSGAANIQSRGTREEKLGYSHILSRLALVICTVFVHTSPLTGWGTLSRHFNFFDSFFIWGTWITILDLFNSQKHC